MNVPKAPAGPPPKPSSLMPPGMPRVFEDPKQRDGFQAIWKWMSTTGQYLDKLALFAGYYQLHDIAPAKHNATHLPDSEIDPLTVGTPSGLANANAEGTTNAFVRQDHLHKRDVRVFQNGAEVATRNHLNFTGGLTATDDSGNDAVNVTGGMDQADLEWLIWVGL